MSTRIKTLLVANRGEIARRIMRTARRLGIQTVAVFSDADSDAAHVREADRAVRIGPAVASESYLSVEAILAAAARTGADAVHPGYGFLAENADFAQACMQAGLTFVGPGPDAIRAMGKKREAKAIAREANVPVIPGGGGEDQSDAALRAVAAEIGFPLLVKASAGGGGKGMRIVRAESELDHALGAARREAKSAFGDDALLIERYIEHPRHIEIQIIGDSQGNVVHLFERECSIQRRHQKIIEESPSPVVGAQLRQEMGEAAVRLAKAIGYQNAGTVEMILAPDGAYYFLEVNTRLQVEHPVTELVTGYDLVELQLRVAEGLPLPFVQDALTTSGWAIEARIYAEDPAQGYLPAIGTVVDWHLPELEGVRLDSGVESGDAVSVHYDPMLAKLIAHGADRPAAIRRLASGLQQLSVKGVRTNLELLRVVIDHPDFVHGALDTHFLDDRPDLAAASPGRDRVVEAAIAVTLAARADRAAAIPHGLPAGFRNNRFDLETVQYAEEEALLEVRYGPQRDGSIAVEVGEARHRARVFVWQAPWLDFELDGLRQRARIIACAGQHHCQLPSGGVTLSEVPRFITQRDASVAGGCVAPMPGKVVAVEVAEGDAVTKGQRLVLLEAMKMEHAVTAPQDGTVREVLVEAGTQVDADAVLVIVE